MKADSIAAKRKILQSQPGKAYHYNSDSVDSINMNFAAYMAKHHPEVRFDEYEGYALAAATDTKSA